MEGASRAVMGATVVMVLSVAIVLGLILMLLVELYCPCLSRQQRPNSPAATGAAASRSRQSQSLQDPSVTPLSHFCSSHGALHVPRSFPFPLASSKPLKATDLKNPSRSQLLQMLEAQIQERIDSEPSTDQKPILEVPLQVSSSVASLGEEHMVRISNPIFDYIAAGQQSTEDTPFGTPGSSPSELEMGGSPSICSTEEGQDQRSPACSSFLGFQARNEEASGRGVFCFSQRCGVARDVSEAVIPLPLQDIDRTSPSWGC